MPQGAGQNSCSYLLEVRKGEKTSAQGFGCNSWTINGPQKHFLLSIASMRNSALLLGHAGPPSPASVGFGIAVYRKLMVAINAATKPHRNCTLSAGWLLAKVSDLCVDC